nr:hypothetical protein L204_03031 [Cryptococcus depauperatus CBS 7855]
MAQIHFQKPATVIITTLLLAALLQRLSLNALARLAIVNVNPAPSRPKTTSLVAATAASLLRESLLANVENPVPNAAALSKPEIRGIAIVMNRTLLALASPVNAPALIALLNARKRPAHATARAMLLLVPVPLSNVHVLIALSKRRMASLLDLLLANVRTELPATVLASVNVQAARRRPSRFLCRKTIPLASKNVLRSWAVHANIR